MMNELPSKPTHAIGEKLHAARKKRAMSLRELAIQAEISASMLSQIETGKAYPSVRSIYNIATALALPVDYFFPEQEDGRVNGQEAALETAQALTASDMREAQMGLAPENSGADHSQVKPGEPVMRAGTRPTIELKGGVTWSRLTALVEAGAEFLEVSYAPGATSGATMSHHEGREFGLILEGELDVELGFEAYHLSAGDSIIFDSTTPHRLVNKSSQAMRAVWVVLNSM
jgi:transcriptional regulator with XRE-family HTH domain/quercetin dioxygenase-like cupin family protein